MSNAQAAKAASQLSGQYVSAGNKDAWLGLFADDAVVQDPVGVSPLDPTGLGHRGKEAIAQFWDMVIAAADIDFQIVSSHPAGDECANVVHMESKFSEELIVVVDMVVVYTANDAGEVTSLKAYWDYDEVQKQLGLA